MTNFDQLCRVCQSPCDYMWKGTLLQKEIAYFECKNCGYVQTEEPYWLDEAYEDIINLSDTGLMARNLMNRKIVLSTLIALGGLQNKVVDFAGGFGVLVRLLRDTGIDAWHSDPYCENLLASGFENNGADGYLVTAFEAFEHFLNPTLELEKMLEIAPNVLLSTDLISKPVPAFEEWWYYGKEHGQHIGFFSEQTLKYLAKKSGKHLASNGKNYHLFSEKKINKLYWKILLYRKNLVEIIARRFLSSKTWTDHLAMSKADVQD